MSIFGRKQGQLSPWARNKEVWIQDGLATLSVLAQHGATVAGLAMAIDQSVQAHKDLATIRAALAEAKAAVEDAKAAVELRKVVANAQAAQATVPAAPKAPKAPKAKAPAGETEVVAAVPAEAKDVTPPPAAPTANRKVGRPRKNAGPAAPAAQA